MAGTGEKAVNPKISGENDLSDISIEISGRDALAAAASLDLGGLATKHIHYSPKSYRESMIIENALKKLKRR